MPDSTHSVTLGIINYNGSRFLEELLDGIKNQRFRNHKTLLLDNASSDASLELVRAGFPWVRLISNRHNVGFSKAGNQILAESASPFICFLNTDIKLDPNWLGQLVNQIERSPDIAAVAPKMLLYDTPNRLNGVGGCMNRLGYTWDRGMFEEDLGQYDEPAPVIFASAGASLFRRSTLEHLGGFDEGMFMYHEDVDLGWRLWLSGHQVRTAPAAVAFHHFAGTTKASRGMVWRELLGERHNIRSLLKNLEVSNLFRALAGLLALRQPVPRKIAQLKNFAWNFTHLGSTLTHRQQIQRERVLRDRDLEWLIVQSSNVPVRL